MPVNKLVASLIAENGGVSKELPAFEGLSDCARDVKKDEDEAQVFFTGEQNEELLRMLRPTYGEPPDRKTNDLGFQTFQYDKNQTGTGLHYSVATSKDGKVTHLVILGPSGLAALNLTNMEKAEADSPPRVKTPEEARAGAIAINAARKHGFEGEIDTVVVRFGSVWMVQVYQKAYGPFTLSGSTATVVINNRDEVIRFEEANKDQKVK